MYTKSAMYSDVGWTTKKILKGRKRLKWSKNVSFIGPIKICTVSPTGKS